MGAFFLGDGVLRGLEVSFLRGTSGLTGFPDDASCEDKLSFLGGRSPVNLEEKAQVLGMLILLASNCASMSS